MRLYSSVSVLLLLFILACTRPPERPAETPPESRAAAPSPQERTAPPEQSAPPQGAPPQGAPPQGAPPQGGTPSTQASSPDIGGLTRLLEDLEPGVFKELPIKEAFTVFDAFESSFEEFERGVGQRIQTMYQVMKDQNWNKEGPVIVVIRGPVDGAKIQAEVTFSLGTAAGNAAEFQLQEGSLPGGTAAVVIHKGDRRALATTQKTLEAWIATEKKTAVPDLRWYVFLNRPDQVEEDDLLTAIVQPLQ
jgi:effector-binding domain-containing protein